MQSKMWDSIAEIQEQVVACRKCARLVQWREETARVKRRMYRDEEYWGRPLAAFGDPDARLLVVGLAPAAHGGNRTGRMFTGDRSGDWLFGALHRAGFANQAESVRIGDGLELNGALITAAARCAPPQNKLRPDELAACRPYITREIELLTELRAVVALGRIAFDAFLRAWARRRTHAAATQAALRPQRRRRVARWRPAADSVLSSQSAEHPDGAADGGDAGRGVCAGAGGVHYLIQTALHTVHYTSKISRTAQVKLGNTSPPSSVSSSV